MGSVRLLNVVPRDFRAPLMSLAREVGFPADARVCEAGGVADRFWVVRSGVVSLDVWVPGRGRLVVDSLGPGDLLGWSWLFPPFEWDFGAEAFTQVRAYEFDGASVRQLCDMRPALGVVLLRGVAEVLAERLGTTRAELVEQHRTHSGPLPS